MKRVLTAAAALPVVLALVAWAPPLILTLAVTLVSVICLDEFLKFADGWDMERPSRWILFAGAVVTFSFSLGFVWVLAALVATFFYQTALAGVRKGLNQAGGLIICGTAGVFYTCFLAGFILMLPRPGLIVLLSIVWVGDSVAYYGGRLIGRHPLAKIISPGKTIEGALLGGIASVAAGIVVGAELMPRSLEWWFLVSAVTATVSQIGDLTESAFKRSANLKDSGHLLPGHGGLLDRTDSLLFAAPVFLLLLSL